MSRLGSNYGAYARVPICRACGSGFIPPAHGGACSERCVAYLVIASEPVLGGPMFGPHQSMLCRGCEMRFESPGLVLCPECYFKARPTPNFLRKGNSTGQDRAAIGADKFEPIKDRNPRSRCHW
jgi:hypothetical protein